MVWGKLFGDKDRARQKTNLSAYAAWMDTLDPTMRNVVKLIQEDRSIKFGFRELFIRALQQGDLEEARRLLRQALPLAEERTRKQINMTGLEGSWASFGQLVNTDIVVPPENYHSTIDKIRIGHIEIDDPDDDDSHIPLFFRGEGHLMTVAPTGAGKGQRYILRALLEYQGPVVVLDPKGENYAETAWRRTNFGQVYKWAPFEDDSDFYNPLEKVNTWDDARLLADLLVEPQNKDPFWDNAAKDLLTGLTYFVSTYQDSNKRNMREVCRILAGSRNDLERVTLALQSSDDERLRELGNVIETQSDALRTSISTTLRTQLEVWRSDRVTRATSSSTPGFNAHDILEEDNNFCVFAAEDGGLPGPWWTARGQLVSGNAASVYLIIPPEEIPIYRSVLRVLLGQLLSGCLKARPILEKNNAQRPDLYEGFKTWPITFIFDEFPQLGYMQIVENAIAITRSFGIRLWIFTQDLTQLKQVYPKWESILANSRCQIFFRPNDINTATEVATRIGRRKDVWGGEDWIASPQTLMGHEFREHAVIVMDGLVVRACLPRALHADERFRSFLNELKQKTGTSVTRAPRPEAPPPEPEPEEDEPLATTCDGGAGLAASQKETGLDGETDDLSDDPEYQAELAALQARMRARKADTSNKPLERPVESSDTDKRPPTPPDFND